VSGFSSSFTDAKEEYIPVSSSSSSPLLPSSSPFPLLFLISSFFFLGPAPSCCCVVIQKRSRIFVFTSLLHFYLKGNGRSSRSSPWKDRSVVVCVSESVWHDRVRSLNRHPPPINRQPKDLKHKIKQEINPREERGEEKEEEIALWRPPIFFFSFSLVFFYSFEPFVAREKGKRHAIPADQMARYAITSSFFFFFNNNKNKQQRVKVRPPFFLFLGSSSATWYTKSLLRFSVFN